MTHEEMKITMRETLLSKGFLKALRAMDFAETFHTGRRKDGSHEFSHQLEMAQMILRLPTTAKLDDTLAVCFLHDVREDYDVPDGVLRNLFGDAVADAVDLLTKEYRGSRIDDDRAYSRISRNAIAAIVKGVDRTHNLQTMDGAFTHLKKQEYLLETAEHIRPMIVHAGRRHITSRHVLAHVLSRLDQIASAPHPPARA